MSETSEIYAAMKEQSQEKKAGNREQSALYLRDERIPFTLHNNGAHLIVEGRDGYIDFWPGTGKWITRSGHKGFGVRNLALFIKSP